MQKFIKENFNKFLWIRIKDFAHNKAIIVIKWTKFAPIDGVMQIDGAALNA